MSKKSGFAVKITAFIEADPKNADTMGQAADKVANVGNHLMQEGYVAVEVESRFMLSKEIADAPKPADPLDIPAHLRRA